MQTSFLTDHLGNSSSTRLLGAIVICDIMAAWSASAFHTGTLPELPQTIVGVLGIAASWLAVNKGLEVSKMADTPQVPPSQPQKE